MKKAVIVLITLLMVAGCLTGIKNGESSSKNVKRFNYMMSRQIDTDLQYSNLEGVTVDVYISTTPGSQPDENGLKVATLVTDKNGKIDTKVSVPTYVKDLWIKATGAGINGDFVRRQISGEKITYDYATEYVANKRITKSGFLKRATTTPAFKVLGTWDANGVPNYRETTRDAVSTTFASLINTTSLPTTTMVNEAYIVNGVETNLNIVEDCDVWVTFFKDNTNLRNALGYYKYRTTEGAMDVTDGAITIIFPNTNLKNSNGGLTLYDKVKIGNFKAGETIVWVLLVNAFNTTTRTVTYGSVMFSSIMEDNPEIDIFNRPHSVLLNTATASLEKRYVFGFKETVWPTTGTGVNDFNDVIFYASTTDAQGTDNTTTAIDPTDVVDLAYDSAKYNSTLTYIYTPASGKYATLVYKDLWPNKGDYDFNDAVIDYNFTEYIDANRNITKILARFIVRVSYAAGNNGFAFELPIPPKCISKVQGYAKTVIGTKDPKHQEYFFFSPVVGLEKYKNIETDKSVILVTDNIKPYLNRTISITVTLNPDSKTGYVINRNSLGFAPYNPFLMSDGNRGREIHLPGEQPTQYAHSGYFNNPAYDDRSLVGSDYTYKDKDGNPWALNLPEAYYYTYDSVNINTAYLHYQEWVDSDGKLYPDWFKDFPGYRDKTKIARP